MQKPRQLKRILYWVTIGILVAVILVCGGLIANKFFSDARDKAEYDSLQNLVPDNVTRPPIPTGNGTEPGVTDPPKDPNVPDATEPDKERPSFFPESDILYQYRALYEINHDMVGYIDIPGTNIQYPVVQSTYQANYYLRRNFYKRSATCGTIYVREACDVNKPSDNVTIYGHKMRNGTMFAELHNYKEQSFWEENRYIYFDTLTEFHTYEIFAVFQTEANTAESFNYHLFDDAQNEIHYNDFISQCKSLSYYDTEITPVYGEKLITLSTCDKDIEDGRLVVVARRIL